MTTAERIEQIAKAAAHHLALAGCTDAEIAAITGHRSLEMVAKYSRKASQRGLAESAQRKRK